MNASGRPNTCKSRGSRSDISWMLATGERVSNAYGTCPQAGDSPGKPGLIPYVIAKLHDFAIKAQALGDSRASH